MHKQHVVVLGGGVAGLSAAHELAERGFRVTVYEQGVRFGGKARSMPVANTGAGGKKDLPGEHGFRFIPGFYKHLPDTMSRIPFTRQDGKQTTVADNLTRTTLFAYARQNEPDVDFPTSVPTSIVKLIELIARVRRGNIPLTPGDLMLFARKLLVLLSSCDARRLGQWEQIAWWDFIEAADRSAAYQKYLGRGITRSLVAMKAEVGSTRTVGYILLQLMLSMVEPGNNLDRLLDGPTNEVWIDPWVAHLRSLGVEMHLGTALRRLSMKQGRIDAVTLEQDGAPFEVKADFYVAAVPVEVFRQVVTPEVVQAAPSLSKLQALRTDWMNGIQLYLSRDVPIVHGHVLYVDSPWALTSVSQHQFWKHVDLSQYANGEVRGVLSIDISDWETPGMLYGKAARDCTREEIFAEVVAQVQHHINDAHAGQFGREHVLYWHLDPDVVVDPPAHTANREPLLVNTIGSWSDRPEARSEIGNLVLASDYVRTFTDLATMEGANEAARRAVNTVLDACGSEAARCPVWPLREPGFFAPLRWLDAILWKAGKRNVFNWKSAGQLNPAPTLRVLKGPGSRTPG